MAAQSVPPALWVVVDDGSTDESLAILEEYSGRLPFLRILRRAERGRRRVGPVVVEAYYAKLETVRLDEFDYLRKLDMDLVLPARSFELMMQR
jgi:glycosyltransferase involved in cell wall biosynthesis